MALLQLEKFLHQIKEFDARKEVIEIVMENGEELVKLQQEQLSHGVDVTGAHRIDEYRPLTIFLKNKFGQGLGAVTDRVTFFMTGELYGSLKPVIHDEKFQIKSPLPTFDKMVDRIGDENYGLSPDQRFEFATVVLLPNFARRLEEKTGIKLNQIGKK